MDRACVKIMSLRESFDSKSIKKFTFVKFRIEIYKHVYKMSRHNFWCSKIEMCADFATKGWYILHLNRSFDLFFTLEQKADHVPCLNLEFLLKNGAINIHLMQQKQEKSRNIGTLPTLNRCTCRLSVS